MGSATPDSCDASAEFVDVRMEPIAPLCAASSPAAVAAVEMIVAQTVGEPSLTFLTNVEDIVTADADHPLRFERAAADGIKPYVRVRGDLWALVKRPLYYDLVELGATETCRGEAWFGVRSCGSFFPMVAASEIDGL